MSVIEINSQEELNDLVSTEETVIVKMTADWCVKCKKLHPNFVGASERSDATFVSLDVDKNDWASVEFGVQGLPTLIRFDGGAETKRASGTDAMALLREV